LTQIQQWIAWGIAALAAAWIVLRVRRSRALHAGIALIFAALVISFLVFQANFLWCPPTLPVALIGVGADVGFDFRAQSSPAA
jgi:CHASE2 domain-containing sensor protein